MTEEQKQRARERARAHWAKKGAEYNRLRRAPEARAHAAEQARTRRQADPDAHNTKRRERYAAKPDGGERAARKRHYEANRDQCAEYARNRRADPAKKAADDALKREWIAANQDKRADNEARRRAAIKTATVEKVSRLVVWERDGGICYICDLPADPARWHLDHTVPINVGGPHSYANVAVSHPSCNMRKHGHDPRTEGSPYAYLLTKVSPGQTVA